MKSQNNQTYHIYVSGRVQGVGYRRFAQKNAEALSVAGWTRNLMDGRVEIMAQGPQPVLEEYCEILRKGPAFSQVREVEVRPSAETFPEREFLILKDVEFK